MIHDGGTLRTFSSACAASFFLLASESHAQTLAPPPPITWPSPAGPSQQQPSTGAELAKAETEDSGRTFEFAWTRIEVGGRHAALGALGNDASGLAQTSGVGGAVGILGGVRFYSVSAGLSFRVAPTSLGTLGEFGGRASYHVPIGKLDPYAGVSGEYSFMMQLSRSSLDALTESFADDVHLRGYAFGLHGGMDYYLTSLLSVGGELECKVQHLSRSKMDVPAGASPVLALHPLFSQAGSVTGLQTTLSAHVGFHFGL